jgi:cyanophycinase
MWNKKGRIGTVSSQLTGPAVNHPSTNENNAADRGTNSIVTAAMNIGCSIVTVAGMLVPSLLDPKPTADSEGRSGLEKPESPREGPRVREPEAQTDPATAPRVHTEKLILVGGGDLPKEALSRFALWAGGQEARILVINWATADPEGAFQRFKSAIEPFAPAYVEAAPLRSEMLARKNFFLKQLEDASGVFFTGGDQTRIMAVLEDQDLLIALQRKFSQGVVFGGTSAGTAIMSETMITGDMDYSDPENPRMGSSPGLGLLKGTVVDQHFLKRSRMDRLVDVMLYSRHFLGIGVDEDTALSIEGSRYAEVLGPGQVVILNNVRSVDSTASPARLPQKILSSGEKMDLKNPLP